MRNLVLQSREWEVLMDPKAITRKLACKPCLGRLVALLLLVALAAVGLAACNEKDPTGTDLTTSSEGAQARAEAGGVAADASAAPTSTAALTASTLPLPVNQDVTSSLDALAITQKGGGSAGRFRIDNPTSGSHALVGQTNGNGYSVAGWASGSKSSAGYFEIANLSNPYAALVGKSNGPGSAILGVSLAANGQAGMFENTYYGNFKPALRVRTGGSGPTAVFEKTRSANAYPVIVATNNGTGYAGAFVATTATGRGVYIETQGGAGLQVVGGSKNAVVRTPSGAKALYTEESTEVWFTDYGFGKLTNGKGRILFDPSFAQTINADESYHVFVQPYGRAELYIAERTPLGFTVALKDGDPNAEFSYRIVAKRLGFEGKRLEAAPWVDHLPAQD
jgi:hypothetical protein